MPRGYPDFFGSATFFKFGNLRAEAILTNIAGTTQATLADIAYKGKTYGGYCYFRIDSRSVETTFILTLDGEVITWTGIYNLLVLSMADITQQLMKLTRFEYDGTDYHCVVSFAPDITFDYQFKLEVINGNAGLTNFSGTVIMAEVA